MKTPLYPAVRTYRGLFNRGAEAQRARMGAFYSQFFRVGDLVFDLGANQGEHAEVLAGEGARVVAVEPNPAFATRLQAFARDADIQPVLAAIGDEPGTAVLNVCSEPGFSTLVDPGSEWIQKSPDYKTVSCVFRPIMGREYRFETPEWMGLAEAREWLAAFSVEQAEYGDMFAHRL